MLQGVLNKNNQFKNLTQYLYDRKVIYSKHILLASERSDVVIKAVNS